MVLSGTRVDGRHRAPGPTSSSFVSVALLDAADAELVCHVPQPHQVAGPRRAAELLEARRAARARDTHENQGTQAVRGTPPLRLQVTTPPLRLQVTCLHGFEPAMKWMTRGAVLGVGGACHCIAVKLQPMPCNAVGTACSARLAASPALPVFPSSSDSTHFERWPLASRCRAQRRVGQLCSRRSEQCVCEITWEVLWKAVEGAEASLTWHSRLTHAWPRPSPKVARPCRLSRASAR